MKMTMYLLIQEQLRVGVLGSIKGQGWRLTLLMALADKPQKAIWKRRQHLPTRDLN